MAHAQQEAIQQMTRIFNDHAHPDRWALLKTMLDAMDPAHSVAAEPMPRRRAK